MTLGTDIHGNIPQTDNAIDGIEARLTKAEEQLQNTKAQLKTAKIEVEKPFAKEDELQQKLSRLTELNAKLDMNKGDVPTLGDEPDEKPGNTEKAEATEMKDVDFSVWKWYNRLKNWSCVVKI